MADQPLPEATAAPLPPIPPARPPAPASSGPVRIPGPPARQQPDFSLATVNIVLLLVLFFLVAGTIVAEDEQAVALPETVDLPLDELPRPLVRVREDGDLGLDGVPMTLTAIVERLTADAAPEVFLLAAREMPALRFLEIVAGLEPSGAAISLVTLRNTTLRTAPPATGDGEEQAP